jgi:hypothetical protein
VRILRTTAFVDARHRAHVEFVAICEDGIQRAFRFTFNDARQLGEAAEKLHLVAALMLRSAPTATPGASAT